MSVPDFRISTLSRASALLYGRSDTLCLQKESLGPGICTPRHRFSIRLNLEFFISRYLLLCQGTSVPCFVRESPNTLNLRTPIFMKIALHNNEGDLVLIKVLLCSPVDGRLLSPE